MRPPLLFRLQVLDNGLPARSSPLQEREFEHGFLSKSPTPPAPKMSHRRPPSTSSKEKYDSEKIENVDTGSQEVIDIHDEDGELLLPERREQAERKLVRKLDFRLLPTIILIFILNYIDVRISSPKSPAIYLIFSSVRPCPRPVSKASNRISTSQVSFHYSYCLIVHIVYISTDIQYETVLAVLYASYVPAQIPSNMILNRISRYVILPGNLQPTHSPHRPSLYIPACICIWGMTSALTGVRSSKYLIDTVLIINS